MTSDTQKKINYAIGYLKDINLESIPEVYMTDLLNALRKIDDEYKSMCDEFDEDNSDEVGTSYKTGISIEFYIDSDDWHEISLILRKIENNDQQDSKE